jgi:hypothetical protein
MPIGDVNSSERGSGARFNDGKLDLTLLPPWCWSEILDRVDDSGVWASDFGREFAALQEFWEGDDEAFERVIDGLTEDDYIQAAKVFAYGAEKYAAWNWAKGMAWSIPMACYLRHMLLGDPAGEDPESGLPHRGHAVCNLIMLAHFVVLCRDMDDRPLELRDTFHQDGEDRSWQDVIADDDGPDLSRLRERIEQVLGPDVGETHFEVTYWEDGMMRVSSLRNLPTSVLNELVEIGVEEQESRERILRTTGVLT